MREDLSRILDHLEVSSTPQPILLGDLVFIIFTSAIATGLAPPVPCNPSSLTPHDIVLTLIKHATPKTLPTPKRSKTNHLLPSPLKASAPSLAQFHEHWRSS